MEKKEILSLFCEQTPTINKVEKVEMDAAMPSKLDVKTDDSLEKTDDTLEKMEISSLFCEQTPTINKVEEVEMDAAMPSKKLLSDDLHNLKMKIDFVF